MHHHAGVHLAAKGASKKSWTSLLFHFVHEHFNQGRNHGNDGKPYPGGQAIIRNKKFASSVGQKKLTELAQYAVDQFGYPYDKDEIAKIAARILAFHVPFTKKQLKKIEPDREFICSEYVARCCEQVGLDVQWNQLGFVAPSDFAADPSVDLVALCALGMGGPSIPSTVGHPGRWRM